MKWKYKKFKTGFYKGIICNGGAIITRYSGNERTVSIPSRINRAYRVIAIALSTFEKCESVTSVEIPASVLKIGVWVSNDLTSIQTNINDSNLFSAFPNLERITVDPKNNKFMDVDGVLFSKDKTKLFAFPAGRKIKAYQLPDSVRSVAGLAFHLCTGLSEIELSENLETIGVGAFWGCTSLTELHLPDKLRSIGYSAFLNCVSLKSMNIPRNVEKLSDGAFAYCNALENITVDKENPAFADIDGVLYARDKTSLIAFPNHYPSKDYVIPKGVTSLRGMAFQGALIERISIPDGVTEIPDNTFGSCTELKTVELPKTIQVIGEWNFDNNVKVHYSGTKEAWEKVRFDATNYPREVEILENQSNTSL